MVVFGLFGALLGALFGSTSSHAGGTIANKLLDRTEMFVRRWLSNFRVLCTDGGLKFQYELQAIAWGYERKQVGGDS